MKILRDESGQVMVLMALFSAFILIGFLALSVDIGLLYHARQNAQIAADAAAIAAAVDYEYNNSTTSAEAAGQSASTTNGYTNGTNSVVVAVVTPPGSGPTLGTGFFEATVTAPTSTSNFMAALGFPSITVSARAVAGLSVGGACIWALSSTGVGFDVQGSYDIEAPQCGAYVNSISSNAIKVTGNGGTMNTKFVDVVGSSVGQQTSPTPITTGSPAQNNPWANYSAPNPATVCTTGASGNTYSGTTFNASSTLPTAATVSGISYVCFSNPVTMSGTVNLGPTTTVCNTCTSTGTVYVFEGNLTIATGATVNVGTSNYDSTSKTFSGTNGGMFDLSCSTCTLNQGSNSLLKLFAPTAGAYDGIAIYQPASNTTELQVQFGSNNETLDGYIFAPGAKVFMQDSGGGVTASGIVADTIFDKTSQLSIPLDYDTANASTTLNRAVVLVE